jgi:drug/metabolite transporter (DMT)-like permease
LGLAIKIVYDGRARMSALALVLVVIAAAMHAGWNLLAKRSADRLTFLWLLTVTALALFFPVFVVEIVRHPSVRPGLLFVFGSTATHLAYFFLLARAYERADLSLAYPIARGFGVVLTTLLAVPIYDERPTAVAWLGIVAILAGMIWLYAPSLARTLELGGWQAVVTGPALLTGVAISCYSLIDAGGVRRINQVVYLYMLFAFIALAYAPFILLTRREAIRVELRRPGSVLLAGFGSFGTYLIVLSALRLAPVAYVIPVREVSIVFAALLGAFVLKESFGWRRYAACALVSAGVIFVGVGG